MEGTFLMIVTQEIKRESRSINFLLSKYKTKQPGEINPKTVDLKKEWRENQKVRVAFKQMEELNVKGELQKQCEWIIREGPNTKDLCARCKYETVTLAIVFYLKFNNTKKRPLSHYKIARELGLTEQIYSNIVTKLGRFFQEKMALTGRIRQYNDS